MAKYINDCNMIVSVGSVDGVLTTAALIAYIDVWSKHKVGVQFTQAFQVDRIDPSKWEANRKVCFIDLAVNSRDEAMTHDFVRRVLAAGHEIIGICDEHDAAAWQKCCEATGVDWNRLVIQPKTRGQEDHGLPGVTSSGSLLWRVLYLLHPYFTTQHIELLCADADAADRMDFTTHYGALVNNAVKSDIANDARREYLARWFAFNREPDATILGWCAEYEAILANHEEILSAREDLGDGIVRVDSRGKKVDMTSLMGELYKLSKVAIVIGESYDNRVGRKVVAHSFGVQKGDIMVVLSSADGVTVVSGFASKVTVTPESGDAAIAAVRAWLQNQA